MKRSILIGCSMMTNWKTYFNWSGFNDQSEDDLRVLRAGRYLQSASVYESYFDRLVKLYKLLSSAPFTKCRPVLKDLLIIRVRILFAD